MCGAVTTWRVARLITLPPVMVLWGHKPSQEAKFFSVFQRVMSRPTSEMIVCEVTTSMPSMLVRSAPLMRYSSSRRSNCGELPRGRLEGFLGGKGFSLVSILFGNVARCA